MKRLLHYYLLLCISMLFSINSYSQGGYEEHFISSTLPTEWAPNDQHALEAVGDSLKIYCTDLRTAKHQIFGVTLNTPIDMSVYKTLKHKSRATASMAGSWFAIYMEDALGNRMTYTEWNGTQKSISNTWTEYTHDFTGRFGAVDSTQILKFYFRINTFPYTDTIYMDWFKAGIMATDINRQPTIDAVSDITGLYNTDPGQSVNLSGISYGADATAQTITVTAASNNTSVINNVSVVYTSANPTGTLNFDIAGPGTATITVTVKDNGGTANGANDTKTMSFDVEVLDATINYPPEINNINNVNYLSTDAGSKTVPLAGITDGNTNLTQSISITATAPANVVISNLAVNYTSANSTGNITYDITGTAGTVTVTVTVTDGAESTSSGSAITVKTFDIKVLEPNGTGWFDDFNDNSTAGFSADKYLFEAKNGEIYISGNTKKSSDNFMYTFSSIDMSSFPYLSFKVKGEINPVNISFLYLMDQNGKLTRSYKVNRRVTNVDNMYEMVYDFTGHFTDSDNSSVDATKITGFLLCINQNYDYYGTFVIDDLKIGSYAAPKPYIEPLNNYYLPMNSGAVTAFLRNLYDGSEDGVNNPMTITASSSNTAIIPNPTVNYTGGGTGSLSFAPVSNQHGIVTISVTVSAAGVEDQVMSFDVSVENNIKPTIDAIANQEGAVSVQQEVAFKGVYDGNKSIEQALIVTAVSQNTAIIPNPITIEYTNDNPQGKLVFTPVGAGTATIDVTVQDDGGTANGGENSTSTSFDVTVYNNYNYPPTIDEPFNYGIFINSSNEIYTLTGLSDGNGGTQNMSITVESSDESILPNPTLNYTPGLPTATLTMTPVADKTGLVTITVTLTDDGGDGTNNGDQTVIKTFNIEVQPIPPTGWIEEFDGDNEYIEKVNWGGLTRSFSSGEMILTSVNRYRPTGMMYYFPERINIKANPYISFEVNITSTNETGIRFSCKPYIGENQAQIRYYSDDADNVTITRVSDMSQVSSMTTNEWYLVSFMWTDGEIDGSGNALDLTKLDSINIIAPEGDIFNASVTGEMRFRNMKAGDDAFVPGKMSRPTIDGIADLALFTGAGAQTIQLSGITDGVDGSATPTFIVSSDNTSLIPSITKTTVDGNGNASITFTPSGTGSATVTLVVSASNANGDQVITFDVDVLSTSPATTTVNIDQSITYQKIMGFGFSEVPERFADLYINDLGASITKEHPTRAIEPVNDNSDPNVLDMSAFQLDILELEKYAKFKEMGLEHIVYNPLTPPVWMKESFSYGGKGYGSSSYETTLTKLDTNYLDEYAEYLTAVLTAYRQHGIEISGISMQNEPAFEVVYGTTVYNPWAYARTIEAVGPKLEAEGFGDVKIFGANQVFTQNAYSPADYFNAILNNPIANQYCDAFSVHAYEPDGIGAATPGATQWASFYAQSQMGTYPKEMWICEGGVFDNNWDGAMTNALGKIDGLKYGKLSTWIHWTLVGDVETVHACVGPDGSKTSRYYVCKNFYKYIRPGALQVESSTTNTGVQVVSFLNDAEHGGDLTTVVVNTTNAPVALDLAITGGNVPNTYELYTTSENRNFEYSIVAKDDIILMPASSVITIVGKGNPAPTIDDIADQYVAANAGNVTVDLTSLSDGDGMTQGLSITATSDNVSVVPNPSISYTYPATTGTLTFNPNSSGTAIIEVVVTDGGTPVAGIKKVSFKVNVSAVNSAPTVNAISDVTINEDAAEQTITLTGITDGDMGLQTIAVTATGGDANLFSTPIVTYAGGSSADIKFTPVANANGSADITITLQDNGGTANGGVDTYSETFTITINAVNDAPGIDPISNQAVVTNSTINVDLSGIVDNDPDATQTLTVTASSSDAGNCPDPTVTYTSDNETGSLAITPTADGTYTITVTVSDNGGTANGGVNQKQITFDVFAAAIINNNPTLNAIADEAILEDAGAQTVNLTGISDGNGGSQTLTIVATSSNTALVADPSISYTNGDATGTLSYSPVAGASGTATITVTATDNGTPNVGQVIRSFDIVVTAVNDAPTADAIANPAAILEGAGMQTVNVTGITDGDNGLQGLTVTASSSNTTLIPTVSVNYTSGSTATLTYTPGAGESGTATITITIKDDAGTANSGVDTKIVTFDVVVGALNNTPTVDGVVPPAVVLEDATGTFTANITGISDGGDGNQVITVEVSELSDGLIENLSVDYTSPNTTATVSYTLAPNANGNAIIEVTVSDDGGTANGATDNVVKQFTQVITAVNDAPTIDPIANTSLKPGIINLIPISNVTDGDPEIEQTLISNISFSKPELFDANMVDLVDNLIALETVATAEGTATVTITLNDGGDTDNGGVNETIISFDVTIGPDAIETISNSKMLMYPNPATNMVNIELPSAGFEIINISSIDGKSVLTAPLSGEQTNLTLDIGWLQTGTYIISFSNNTQQVIDVLIIH